MFRNILVISMFIALLGACSAAPGRPGADGILAPCGSLPNCVNSQSGEGGHKVEPLRATAEQWQTLKQWLGEQADWNIVVDDRVFVQVVVVSPLMRYRDDLQLLYQPNRQLIQVRSSSRLGISDMGVNRSRVEALRFQIGESGR